MDEYLSDKEQLERVKQWWNDYGWYLLGGAALAVIGLYGWNQYEAYRDNLAEQASALYVELQQSIQDDRGNELELLAGLREQYPDSPYTQQAALLVASELVVRDPERAEAELRTVMNEADDEELALIARMRLARLLAYRERPDEALELLDMDAPGRFAASVAQIEGDIHMALGNAGEARDAYSRALTAAGAQSLDRNVLQMKLNALQPADTGAAPAAQSAAPAAAGEAPESEVGAPATIENEAEGGASGSAEASESEAAAEPEAAEDGE